MPISSKSVGFWQVSFYFLIHTSLALWFVHVQCFLSWYWIFTFFLWCNPHPKRSYKIFALPCHLEMYLSLGHPLATNPPLFFKIFLPARAKNPVSALNVKSPWILFVILRNLIQCYCVSIVCLFQLCCFCLVCCFCVCVYVIYFNNVLFSCGAKEKKSTFTLGLGCFMVAYD